MSNIPEKPNFTDFDISVSSEDFFYDFEPFLARILRDPRIVIWIMEDDKQIASMSRIPPLSTDSIDNAERIDLYDLTNNSDEVLNKLKSEAATFTIEAFGNKVAILCSEKSREEITREFRELVKKLQLAQKGDPSKIH